MHPYKIVVPSRKRQGNMKHLRRLLPEAYICVEDSEVDAYAKAGVPEDLIIPHPELKPMAAIRNWILDNVDSPTIVMCDDDLDYVRSLVIKYRQLRSADDIRRIVENSLACTKDLDLGVFCWSRTGNRLYANCELVPVRPVGLMAGCFGMTGTARDRRFDIDFAARGDLECSLRTLMEDRIMYLDTRFYWHFGKVNSGVGGGVGLITKKKYEAVTQRLQDYYGPFVQLSAQESKFGSGMKIRVRRRNPGSVDGGKE